MEREWDCTCESCKRLGIAPLTGQRADDNDNLCQLDAERRCVKCGVQFGGDRHPPENCCECGVYHSPASGQYARSR